MSYSKNKLFSAKFELITSIIFLQNILNYFFQS